MSSAVNNLGTFDPNAYKINGTGGRPNQRMAGDYLSEFANQNANDEKDKDNSPSFMGNNGKSYGTNTERMLFGNSESKNTNVNNTSNKATAAAPQQAQASGNSTAKTVSAAAPQQSPVTYDEDQYKYYTSDLGSGKGAQAYAKDMEEYQGWVKMNETGPAAGHLGLIAAMHHPDWARSQTSGGGNPIVTQDYSQPSKSAYGLRPPSKMDKQLQGGRQYKQY